MISFLGANNKSDWYIDSGATRHMTPHDDLLENTKNESDKITAANGAQIKVTGSGNGKFTLGDGNVNVSNILHVPDLAVNLLSVSQIVKNGNTVVFDPDGCAIYNSDKKKVLSCKSSGGIYRVGANDEKCFMTKNSQQSALIWHRRLGHANFQIMKKMRDGVVNGIKFDDDDSEISQCDVCPRGKQVKMPFKASESASKDILEIIHSDLMGPQKTRSIGHAVYYRPF